MLMFQKYSRKRGGRGMPFSFHHPVLLAAMLLVMQSAFAQSSIIGKVVNTTGSAVPFASILLDKDQGTTSDEQGVFHFPKVNTGKHTLYVSYLGHTPTSQEIVLDSDEKQVVMTITEQTAQLNPVVITATRSEREANDLPMPVMVIPGSQIKNMGSLRLNNVLAEQTGLTLISDHGTGIQVQGFDPEYTLILIDGEPLIGRTAGTLELNRIAVGNIKQIEIVKGPSSSLYGSEALAGVINIITEKPNGTNGNINTRYGTNQTADLSATVNHQYKKLGVFAFADRYSTDGYDLSPENAGKTVSPFQNYTLNSKITYDFSARTKLTVSGRYFNENQQSVLNIGSDAQPQLLNETGKVNDWNINPVFVQRFTDHFKTTFRFYGSKYSTNATDNYQSDGQVYDQNYFIQGFYRGEVQSEYFLNKKNIFTLGGGRIWETVEATRYDDKMRFQTNYLYLQYEWQPIDKMNVIAGGRYDDHSAYNSQFSPKLALQYQAVPWLSVRGSAGVGFKAPDFRQLYLNFTNASVGYSVFGSQDLSAGIARLRALGQIQEILTDPSSFGAIKAESSKAYNLGFKVKASRQLSFNVNAFRNDVKDLIDTKVVAIKTNGQFVYSYYNLAKVFTEGVETDATWYPVKNITISLGHQYLIAKDKAVVEELKKGEVFARDPKTQATKRVTASEYGGLFNRSKHMINAKIFYENPANGYSASFRAIYRGRYGYADMNNNAILDADNEYIAGYVTYNVSAGKTIRQWLKVQVGCDNLLNYKNASYIPTLPGRLLWASVGFTFSKKQNQ